MRENPASILHPDRSRDTAGTFPRSPFSLLERSGQLEPAEVKCLFTGRDEGTAAEWPSLGALLRGGEEAGRARGLLPWTDRYLCTPGLWASVDRRELNFFVLDLQKMLRRC